VLLAGNGQQQNAPITESIRDLVLELRADSVQQQLQSRKSDGDVGEIAHVGLPHLAEQARRRRQQLEIQSLWRHSARHQDTDELLRDRNIVLEHEPAALGDILRRDMLATEASARHTMLQHQPRNDLGFDGLSEGSLICVALLGSGRVSGEAAETGRIHRPALGPRVQHVSELPEPRHRASSQARSARFSLWRETFDNERYGDRSDLNGLAQCRMQLPQYY
jgi:hypothetical protein